jgi:hypothetical protein
MFLHNIGINLQVCKASKLKRLTHKNLETYITSHLLRRSSSIPAVPEQRKLSEIPCHALHLPELHNVANYEEPARTKYTFCLYIYMWNADYKETDLGLSCENNPGHPANIL